MQWLNSSLILPKDREMIRIINDHFVEMLITGKTVTYTARELLCQGKQLHHYVAETNLIGPVYKTWRDDKEPTPEYFSGWLMFFYPINVAYKMRNVYYGRHGV